NINKRGEILMNIKIDVNINLANIEAIVGRISKMMDLNKVAATEITNVDNKSQSIAENIEAIDNSYKAANTKENKADEISEDTLKYLLTDLSRQGKSVEVKTILKKYNCTKIPHLKKSDYNKVYKELNNIKQKI
ncbi:MAG: hypothetical protein ACRCXT_05995, partial [Paraclostridium sp.]